MKTNISGKMCFLANSQNQLVRSILKKHYQKIHPLVNWSVLLLTYSHATCVVREGSQSQSDSTNATKEESGQKQQLGFNGITTPTLVACIHHRKYQISTPFFMCGQQQQQKQQSKVESSQSHDAL